MSEIEAFVPPHGASLKTSCPDVFASSRVGSMFKNHDIAVI